MAESLEGIIRQVYRQWKARGIASEEHPDEEFFLSFLENKLSAEEDARIKAHLVSCGRCAEIAADCIRLRQVSPAEEELPAGMLERAKDLFTGAAGVFWLEIALRLKEKAIEIFNTSGDVLVGRELVPAAVLRSRQIKEFKDEVVILKDFKNIRVEVRVENKEGRAFNLSVLAREKDSQKTLKDLRVSLLRQDTELESYLTDTGKAVFEQVLLGRYTVELSSASAKLAAILLDIKV